MFSLCLMLCFVCLFHINLYCVLTAIRILFYFFFFSFFSRFIFSYVVFNLYSCHVVIMLCFNIYLFCRIFILLYFILFLVFLLMGPRPKLLGPILQPFFRFFFTGLWPKTVGSNPGHKFWPTLSLRQAIPARLGPSQWDQFKPAFSLPHVRSPANLLPAPSREVAPHQLSLHEQLGASHLHEVMHSTRLTQSSLSLVACLA